MFSEEESGLIRKIIEKTKKKDIIWQLAKSEKDGAVSYAAHCNNGLALKISKIPGGAPSSFENPKVTVFDYCLTVGDERGLVELRADQYFTRLRLAFLFNIIGGLATKESEEEREKSNLVKQLTKALD